MEAKKLFDYFSLPQKIAEEIAEQIIIGELKPGEKIVEKLIADQYSTSRAPVREALYLLSMEGLVSRIPRKGTVVKGYSVDEINDLIQIRVMLEKLALNKVNSNGPDAYRLNKMKELIPLMERAKDQYKEYTQLNREFHTEIILMSNSEVIKTMYNRLGTPLFTLQRISFSQQTHIDQSLEEHKKIVHLLMENKITDASILLEKHNQVSDRIKINRH